jgi:hypothetical protein
MSKIVEARVIAETGVLTNEVPDAPEARFRHLLPFVNREPLGLQTKLFDASPRPNAVVRAAIDRLLIK